MLAATSHLPERSLHRPLRVREREGVSVLEPSDPQNNQAFGSAVAISGSLALAGAPQFNIPGGANNVGAAYVFQRQSGQGWVDAIQLRRTSGASGDMVGLTLAIARDQAIVGVPSADIGLGTSTQEGARLEFSDLPDPQDCE